MCEPVATVPLRNAMPSSASDASKLVWLPRSDTANVLLLQRPARLDRIQVGRVRRQIDDANAASGAGRTNPPVVVRREIVHHDDIPAAQPWQQLRLQPCHEPVLVGGR